MTDTPEQLPISLPAGVTRTQLASALVRLRPKIVKQRDEAILACVLDPANWQEEHGEPIADLLARLDRLDALCAQAEAEMAGG